ncbi:MAG: zinc-dependent alcohol dehydrogenase family protein [Actinobacteria bacterium]|nr:zinc-dependent alcohol dehydrogenase family protein [Actinomycetota bacterium]
MRAMILEAAGRPLRPAELSEPAPGPGQVRVKVEACGLCRTDLHVVDGELPHPKLPLIPGHQIVGIVDAVGGPAVGPDAHVDAPATEAAGAPATGAADVPRSEPGAIRPGVDAIAPRLGDRVGIPWLGWTCGRCRYCLSGRENLCDQAKFTGYDLDGGFAEYAVVDRRFAFPIPSVYPALQAAPLLCAGLIGYRSLAMTGDAERLGVYGYGAAAHIVTQVARHLGRRVFAFTRPGDFTSQAFALEMGVEWAGDTAEPAPEELDAAIIFAPAGELVPLALRAVAKGGVVVCGGIHMSDIPSFPYEILWGERMIRSVANLTRRDGEEFLALAPRVPVRTEVELFTLEDANEAIGCLRTGNIRGAAVIVIDDRAR